jgi:hypothetical protein
MTVERIVDETSLFDHTGYRSASFGLYAESNCLANPGNESHTQPFADSINARGRPN